MKWLHVAPALLAAMAVGCADKQTTTGSQLPNARLPLIDTPLPATELELRALENQMWQHWKDRNWEAMQMMFAPEVAVLGQRLELEYP